MFRVLAEFVERQWRSILAVWLVLLLCAMGVLHGWFNQLGFKIPQWREVAEDGEFAYLPAQMQSLVGEKLLARAFPNDLLTSSVVIVVRRESHELIPEDEAFIESVLKPRLEQIRAAEEATHAGGKSLIASVRTFKDPLMGRLLVSADRKASLVIVALTSEFLEYGNRPTIKQIEDLIQTLRSDAKPPGLDLAMSGTATVGRDMLEAGRDSARATERWTMILVILLLGAIYRAPLIAAIPLLTVFASVQIALALELLLTQAPFLKFRVFLGMEVYITVVVYGAGVDYCLFLIARYKEELDAGRAMKQAVGGALQNVGSALTASAGTVICGIGMMVFAQFGKFREAGIGISISLCVVLLAALTFTPALLCWVGRAAFWPKGRDECIPASGGWLTGTRLFSRLVERGWIQAGWEHVGKWVVRHPARILAGCVLLMAPFAFVGVWFYDYLSYGLLSELPPTRQSVIGAKAVQEHFPAGYAGPLTIVLQHDGLDFASPAGLESLQEVIARLDERRSELGISDVRYVRQPLGLNYRSPFDKSAGNGDSSITSAAAAAIKARRLEAERRQALRYYVSSEYQGHVTRIDVIFDADPFSRENIRQLNAVERAIRDHLPPALEANTTLNFLGPTASIRDLKTVTDDDQIKIDLLVLAGVFSILVVLLKKPAISLYLIVTVFFSYFVTLGATLAMFWWLDPANFSGLDWKVPMFLFTILIAIGEDYNIFLMTRIDEEQRRYGPVEGVRVALLRTGSIISSCGIIMAGTFLSLMASTLVGMQQLGFALAFGVLLDTFVVRPVLVPSYLILLYSGRFGWLGRFLGETRTEPQPAP